MAWDPSTTVTIGNYTKASDLNSVAANADWLQQYADIGHEFSTTAPTGKHKPKFVVGYPSVIKTGENAQKIIKVRLDDVGQVWDLQAALQAARNTSWWAAPPMHAVLMIHEDQNSVTWYNTDSDAQHIQIDGAASGIIDDATPVLTSVFFLDFKIYLCGSGGVDVTIIDLLRDTAYRYSTGGLEQYKGTLGDFTGTAGWLTLDTALATFDDTCSMVGAVRDPSLTDEFGRPKHWWIQGSSATLKKYSIYNPVADAIYDGTHAHASDVVAVAPSGIYGYLRNDSGAYDYFFFLPSIFAVAAENPAPGSYMYVSAYTAGALGFATPWSSAAVVQDAAWLDGAGPDGAPICAVAHDEGLTFAIVKGDANESSSFHMDADKCGPLGKGDRRAEWPLNSVSDFSGHGHTLTNNNTVTFTDGGPAGSYANFDGVNQSLERADHADFGGMADLTIAFWLYRDVDSGALEGLVGKYDQGAAGDQSFNVHIDASDNLGFSVDTDVGDVGVTSPGTIATGQWYYVVAVADSGTTGFLRLYLQGVLVKKTGTGHATIDDSAEKLFIGALSSGDTAQNFFDGRIAGVSISASVMTAGEIWWEYQRGLRRIQSTVDVNDALSNVDVKTVQADQESEHWIITDAGDAVTILDKFGVPISTDAAPAGTIRDACIWMPEGQDAPSYAMATSTRMELVQTDRRVFD